MTQSQTALLDKRTFKRGDSELVAPVDALGRMRFRAALDRRAVTRAEDGEEVVGFAGHAAVFNKRTWIGSRSWGFWEEIAPGAFRKSIGENDVRFLKNHDPNLLMARNKAGTLRLSEDDVGLATDADMDTRQSYVADTVISLERGDISQMSFAFDPIAWTRQELDDGEILYTLTELRLWDVSVVTYPAYEDTDAALRAAGFEAVTRSLKLEPRALLERLGDADFDAYVQRQISPSPDGDTEPGKPPTREGEPAPATREDSPPDITTGADRSALARRHLAAATTLKEF